MPPTWRYLKLIILIPNPGSIKPVCGVCKAFDVRMDAEVPRDDDHM